MDIGMLHSSGTGIHLRPFATSSCLIRLLHDASNPTTRRLKREMSVLLSPTTCSRFLLAVRCAVRFCPCIDIHKGKVKQIVGSTLKDSNESNYSLVTNFESDKSPAEFANLYREDGLTGGHVIMLGDDALSKSAALEALHAYPGGLQVGGGINSDNALSYLEEGASHVIVTSYLFSDGKMDVGRLKNLANVTGKNRLVLDLSCRKKIPVTYAGGVATMADLERIKIAGMEQVNLTVGSALDIFGGDLPYKDVVAWHEKQQIIVSQ